MKHEQLEYRQPDNTGYVVKRVDAATGAISLVRKRKRWTRMAGEWLAWYLWYINEPGVHVKQTHPDGGVEQWTLPPSYLSEDS